ncbi:anti-sigma factor family protein [Neobacillus sp. NPDC093182]|uniref:anti-sigma factor family protein n=1 Tax=Neobacillus sp. NPDC093182 TaxID=3364297 RepID=UPI003823D6C7
MKMKLDCSLVEDLYPLYEENELRPENRRAVDEHLQTCKKCSELYQQGTGFSELSLSEETLPNDMDSRLRLSFKLRRMKVIAAILATILIVSGINRYAANREKVATLLDGVYLYAESLNELAQNPYEIDSNRGHLSYAAENVDDLNNELLWFERKNTHLLVNSQELDEMAITLRERKRQGLEDETDEKAIELLQTYTNTLFKHVQKEYGEFHHGYSSYLEILDTEGIGTPIEKIDELAFFYNKYHKLPSEMKVIKESEMKEVITKAFNAEGGKIDLEKTNESFGVYHFDLKHGKTQIDGKIDGYSGLITFANNYAHPLHEKNPLNTSDVMKKAEKMLKAIYGENAQFDIKIEENSGEPNLYRFRFTPLAGENRLYFPLGDPYFIELDAGTGDFYLFSGKPAMQSKEFFSNEYEEKLAPNTLEAKAAEISGQKVKALGKGIIYSSVSAGYVLVHIFEGEENRIYLNAETGIVERPYISFH